LDRGLQKIIGGREKNEKRKEQKPDLTNRHRILKLATSEVKGKTFCRRFLLEEGEEIWKCLPRTPPIKGVSKPEGLQGLSKRTTTDIGGWP